MKISVIGAGIGGLASACLLASRGHKVTVYEKNSRVGGKMNLVEAEGFRFDTGPSLLTMPHLLEKLFNECEQRLEDHLKLLPISPICRYNYQDGTVFDCFDDRLKTQSEIDRIAPEDSQSYSQFLDYAESIYNKTADAFIYNPLYDFSDFRNLDLFSFFGIDAFSKVSGKIDAYFESEYLRKFFKRFTTYNGSSPYLAPATLNVIPHVELNQGGFYVDGGMYKIAETLFWLAGSLGVDFVFNAEVSEINVSNKKIDGIYVNGAFHSSDLVVANSDATETVVHLLSEVDIPIKKKEKAAAIEPSCSGFVLLLGIDTQYEQLVHHNIFFSQNYEQEFQQIFEQKVMPGDPTIYIANTSFSNPSHAPEGGSNLFVLVNAPYLSESYDWDKESASYGSKVIKSLEERGLSDLSSHITFQSIITPKDFYIKYLSNKGSIYGTSSNNKFAAFVRPRNKSREIDGLYFAGGSTHPGGGIPLVIQSAFNVVELIDRYEG
ncbi:MAG: phytoene desaturase [Balneolaceae bacterium]|nr:phytoene desaturase [Balneolaceae bacterium]MBO6546376.1 phytoene desaturase [Balneolaceae bacterium]MBO6648735.1 phytoene desaturase [Balneolaceae bacterium]